MDAFISLINNELTKSKTSHVGHTVTFRWIFLLKLFSAVPISTHILVFPFSYSSPSKGWRFVTYSCCWSRLCTKRLTKSPPIRDMLYVHSLCNSYRRQLKVDDNGANRYRAYTKSLLVVFGSEFILHRFRDITTSLYNSLCDGQLL